MTSLLSMSLHMTQKLELEKFDWLLKVISTRVAGLGGQAWALYGYATVYQYTKDPQFLNAAKQMADYFLSRLENGIVYWDFDAPRPCVWNVSVAMIAASGMLLICQLENSTKYVSSVASILAAAQKGALMDGKGVTILDHCI